MIFTDEQSSYIYNELYDWLAVHKPGGRCYKSVLKKYQKRVWEPTIQIINRLSNKHCLSKEEQDFLKWVSYDGQVFRIQNYNPRYKGYICENEFYQSWTCSTDGVAKVSNLNGNVLLIVGNAVNGIDIFGLLTFLFEYSKITLQNEWKHPKQLLRYEEEQEIVYPIKSEYIKEIVVVDKENINDWENHKMSIPKAKWMRNSMN